MIFGVILVILQVLLTIMDFCARNIIYGIFGVFFSIFWAYVVVEDSK